MMSWTARLETGGAEIYTYESENIVYGLSWSVESQLPAHDEARVEWLYMQPFVYRSCLWHHPQCFRAILWQSIGC